jgi:putative oxidoreductase
MQPVNMRLVIMWPGSWTLQERFGGQWMFMPVLRAVARPMLASIFIVQGFDTLRRPERVAPLAEPVVRPIAERVRFLSGKPEQAVRINGAVQVAAGALLALGRWPRLSALAIAATLVPTTLAGHRFWEAEEEQDQAQQRIHFLKNLSMFGGLLIAAADTAGSPSIAWRTRHAAKTARREASLVAKTARTSAKAGAKTAKTSAGAKAAKTSAKASAKAAKASAKAGMKAGRVRLWRVGSRPVSVFAPVSPRTG